MTPRTVDSRIEQALAEGVRHLLPKLLDTGRVLALAEDVRQAEGNAQVTDGADGRQGEHGESQPARV
jgi:hypothetical protein